MSIIKNNKNYGTKVKILQPEPVPLTSTYFYVEDASGLDNTLTITRQSGSPMAIEVFTSTDQINWTSMGTTNLDTPLTATIPADGKLYLKANTTAWGNGWDSGTVINASNYFKVGGNVMSLLNGDNFVNSGFAPNSNHNFNCLFRESNTLINASELQLPATTLAPSCYNGMFIFCSQLMGVPTLPATTLAENCYSEMFNRCISLTKAPVLPATTLVNSCYANMFVDCARLNSITTYAQDISATDCLTNWFGNWFYDMSATGDFYNLGGATYPSGASGILEGWTEHTSL